MLLQAQGSTQARVAATLGSRSLLSVGKAQFDDRTFTTIYEGFKIGKHIAKKYGILYSFMTITLFMVVILGDDRCLGFRIDRQSEYKWITYEEVDMKRKKEKNSTNL